MKQLILVAISAVGFYWIFRAGAGSPGQAQVSAAPPAAQFRITVGYKDAEPRLWKGKLLAVNITYRTRMWSSCIPEHSFPGKVSPLTRSIEKSGARGPVPACDGSDWTA